MDTCKNGLELFPNDTELRFRGGLLLHEMGCLAESVAAYRDVLETREARHFTSVDQGITGFKARQNLAVVYTDLGDLAAAESEWRRVTEEMPNYKAGWRGLGDILLRQRKHHLALELAARLSTNNGFRAEAMMIKGQVAAARGELELARRELEQAAREDPHDPEPLRVLAKLLFERFGPTESEQSLSELVRRDPQDASAYHNLGTVYYLAHQHAKAVETYRKSVELRPNAPGTLLYLGHALKEMGSVEEAVAVWREALRLAPTDSAVLEALGSASDIG